MRGTTSYSICSLVFLSLIQIAFVIFFANYLYYINPGPEGYSYNYGKLSCQIRNSNDPDCGYCYAVKTEAMVFPPCCNDCIDIFRVYIEHNLAINGSEINCQKQVNSETGVIDYVNSGKKLVCTGERLVWHPFGVVFLLVDGLIMITYFVILLCLICCCQWSETDLKVLMNILFGLIMADAMCTIFLDISVLWTYFNYGLPQHLTILVTIQATVGCKLLYYVYSWIAQCKYRQRWCFSQTETEPEVELSTKDTFDYPPLPPPTPKRRKSKK